MESPPGYPVLRRDFGLLSRFGPAPCVPVDWGLKRRPSHFSARRGRAALSDRTRPRYIGTAPIPGRRRPPRFPIGARYWELAAMELRVGMPDICLVPAQACQIRRVAMTLAELGHVVLQRPIRVAPPRRRGKGRAPHGLMAASPDGCQERKSVTDRRTFRVPDYGAFGERFRFLPAHFGQRVAPVVRLGPWVKPRAFRRAGACGSRRRGR